MPSLRRLFAFLLGAALLGPLLGLIALGTSPAPAWAGPLEPQSSSFVTSAVKRVAPAVVRIDTERSVPRAGLDPVFSDPLLRELFGDQLPSSRERGQGSGIVIDSQGLVLTNAHVVDGADRVDVTLADGSDVEGSVLGADPVTDLAVLRIPRSASPKAAPLGDSEALEVGDWAIALGTPYGLERTVTLGIVSSLHRNITSLGFSDKRLDLIQTDAAINPGNSGGALLDVEGRLIGLNTAILSRSGGFNGVGFAIPINQVRAIAEQLVKTGRVDRAFLGVQTQSLDAEISAMFKVNQGALIVDVQSDTPAEKAGLKSGDIITKIDTTTIRDPRHLQLTVTRLIPGTEAKVEYLRDGKPASVKVKLTALPGQKRAGGDRNVTPEANDIGVLNGVGVGDISAELREQLNLPRRIEGAIITSVEADSPSARAGLREGDIILELDRRPVRNADEAVKLSEEIKGPKVLVFFWRSGTSRYLVVDESK